MLCWHYYIPTNTKCQNSLYKLTSIIYNNFYKKNLLLVKNASILHKSSNELTKKLK